jgi:Transmembrane exosortase (Exosortase_EpsH)
MDREESMVLDSQEAAGNQGMRVVLQILILLALSVWVFWYEVVFMYRLVRDSSDMAHVAAMPVAILLLILIRKKELRQSITKGSAWGIGTILFGLVFYAMATWPFSYGYARDLAVIPVWAGIIWVCGGRKLLKRSLPIVLLVFLSIPLGSRLYAGLIIRPETYTIAATTKCVDVLPGIEASMHGTDMFFTAENTEGAIALGESNRGARLLLCYATLGVFVVFSQIRSWKRIIVLTFLAPVVVFFCNFLRLVCWALVLIITKVGPVNPWPKYMAAILSLSACYGIFVWISNLKLNLFVEEKPEDTLVEVETNHVSA